VRDRMRSTQAKVAYFTVGGLFAGAIIMFFGLNIIESTDSPEFCSSCHIMDSAFGRGSIPDVLHATTDSVSVVNNNCIKCHEPSLTFVSHDAKETCSDCHRSVPHGRGMYRPDEWHEPMQRTPVDETIASRPSGGG
jgi:cytochrome c nitrite reductase small subunit